MSAADNPSLCRWVANPFALKRTLVAAAGASLTALLLLT